MGRGSTVSGIEILFLYSHITDMVHSVQEDEKGECVLRLIQESITADEAGCQDPR